MRITLQRYSVAITILFMIQSMLFLLLLHLKSLPQPSLQAQAHSNNEHACQKTGAESAYDVPSMTYLYNKFRVAATEVKRQVLHRKGEHVPAVPVKVHPLCSHNLVVATYNLWNINPPWTIRLHEIVSIIKQVQPGFIGLQEIRKYEGRNQLDLMKEMLPEYKYSIYEKVQEENKGGEEGIGILSKYPISGKSAINLGNTNRKCLHGLIQTPNGEVRFFVTHFSLKDVEQCTHAMLLWEYINSFPRDVPQILVGDMNTYFDFEWPMDMLTQGLTPFMLSPLNPCSSVLLSHLKRNNQYEQIVKNSTLDFHLLRDVWEEVYPAVSSDLTGSRWWGSWAAPPGHTFSNYNDQDPSRTDRMYFHSPRAPHLSICDVSLFGDTPISEENGRKLYPSDHKGVAGYFQLKNEV